MARPSKYEPGVVRKLIAAFNNGYNEREACSFAGITKDTLWRWKEKYPALSDQIATAKDMPNRLAKEKVIEAIGQGDVNSARWWLDRRDPEFKPKAEVDNNIGLQETREKIKDFLDDNSPDDGSKQPATADSPEARGEVADAPTDIS